MDQLELPKSMDANAAIEAWRSAVEDGWRAYRAWCSAPAGEKRRAYALYVAAADREDAAQSVRARSAKLPDERLHLGRLVWPGANRLPGSSWS
jgi:hypothetical protein